MSDYKNFFNSADELNNRILILLNDSKKELDKQYNTNQRISDLKSRVVYKKGIYLPYFSIKHRILYEGYEVQFLSTFIDLFSAMLKGNETIFKEFAIRTISEMGMKDSQIIFSSELSVSEKETFKSVILLGDYAFLGFNNSSRFSDYKKILNDQKDLLTPNQHRLFIELENCISNKDYVLFKKTLKRIRSLINVTRDNLYKKTKSPSIFRSENIETFFSAFSHLIHGNIILLTDLLSETRPVNRNRLRVTWTLLMAGINTLIHVRNFLETKGVQFQLGNLLKNFDRTSKEISNNWREIEDKW